MNFSKISQKLSIELSKIVFYKLFKKRPHKKFTRGEGYLGNPKMLTVCQHSLVENVNGCGQTRQNIVKVSSLLRGT